MIGNIVGSVGQVVGFGSVASFLDPAVRSALHAVSELVEKKMRERGMREKGMNKDLAEAQRTLRRWAISISRRWCRVLDLLSENQLNRLGENVLSVQVEGLTIHVHPTRKENNRAFGASEGHVSISMSGHNASIEDAVLILDFPADKLPAIRKAVIGEIDTMEEKAKERLKIARPAVETFFEDIAEDVLEEESEKGGSR